MSFWLRCGCSFLPRHAAVGDPGFSLMSGRGSRGRSCEPWGTRSLETQPHPTFLACALGKAFRLLRPKAPLCKWISVLGFEAPARCSSLNCTTPLMTHAKLCGLLEFRVVCCRGLFKLCGKGGRQIQLQTPGVLTPVQSKRQESGILTSTPSESPPNQGYLLKRIS